MPPIFLHMAVAQDICAELNSTQLALERGTYLFGATSPDIRVISRWERQRTHYFDLGRLDHQDSVASFFEDQADLQDVSRLDPSTVAFVSGYISHLALDETWIEKVYRPYFGQLSALGGAQVANTMDRVLQFELERRRRADPEATQEIREALAGCSLALNVGFLDGDTLRRWLQVATDHASFPADWERFRTQASRHLRELGVDSEDDWRRFREQIPQLLQETLDHVSTAQVDSFLDEGRELASAAIRRYLDIRA
jgi:hypothetical protein